MATAGLDRETFDGIVESIKEFAGRRLGDPALLRFDAQDEMPLELVRAMCGRELGLALLFVPDEFGGIGAGAMDVYRVCELIAGIDLGIATGVLATSLGSDPIRVGGTDEQRKRWLGRIASEGLLVAYAATEPEAGSDLAALRTMAVPVDAGYRINGRKQWISNGGVADIYCVLALAPAGPSWFIVDKGTDGLRVGTREEKHGIRASNTAAVFFDDVVVNADRLVGGVEGQGLLQAQAVFGYTRLMVGAFGLGAGWSALDRAIAYSRERSVSGGPLADKQGYTHKLLVPHAIGLEAARAFVEETATRIDKGAGNLITEGAIAKLAATEAANRAADAALQALGGYGYVREYMVEKIRRDVRITTIYEGTSEIMEMTIARDRWQAHLKTRGDHYHEQAHTLAQLDRQQPECGARIAALALDALAEVLEHCRLQHLTRSQHVLLRLGEIIAQVECAASLVRRTAAAESNGLSPKASHRFSPPQLAAMARVCARDAALQVCDVGVRWAGASAEALKLSEVHAAQSGLIDDMDLVADALYGRVSEPVAAPVPAMAGVGQ
ncbi:MAG TPA: acyl-CoA dehydrogenase family protein [Candidatus Dormibacteraeota bacterium]|nr:acyl-CoA dehydrogenase family protein [Candidatus Dormibacteraeota bacterium]